MHTKAVILVGGPTKGTRFRPLAFGKVKPLFEIGGFPLLHHHIQELSAIKSLEEIILLGFFEPEIFADFIKKSAETFKLKITYLSETEPLGTGGGFLAQKDEILKNSPSYIFVVHSDVCGDFPYSQMLESHIRHGETCTLMGYTDRSMPRESLKHFGCMIVDKESLECKHYAEKPKGFISDTISCGVYCFSPTIFDKMAEIKSKLVHGDIGIMNPDMVLHKPTNSPDYLSMEHDILFRLCGTGSVYVFMHEGSWLSIKRPGDIIKAQAFFLSKVVDKAYLAKSGADSAEIRGDAIISDSAIVHPSAVIGPNVDIGPKVKIGAGARIRDAVILEGATVYSHAFISRAIVGWGCTVGEWTRTEGLEKDNNVTILAEDVIVNPEIHVSATTALPHKHIRDSVSREILL